MKFPFRVEFFEFTLDLGVRKLFRMSHILIKLALMTLLPIFAAAQTNSEPPSASSLFEKGLSAYQKQQYQEARDAFQTLLDQHSSTGEVNASLLHNLALSAYQLDQKPLAMALWRKALSAQPGFKPARAGRDLLEVKSQMKPFERDSFSISIRRALESVSIYEILWGEALLLALVGWLWIGFISRRQAAILSELPLPQFPTMALFVSIFFMFSTVATALKIKDNYTTRATILVDKANARSLPTADGVALFELRGGNEVLVRRNQNGWLQVQSADGATGWVNSTDALITSPH